jgi:hypothetical protein
MEEPSDTGRDISKGWSERLGCAVPNVALPQFASNDLDPICGVGRIVTAHDSITNRRERLGERALNDAQFGRRRQRDEHECSGNKRSKHTATRSSANDSRYRDDHAASLALMPPL